MVVKYLRTSSFHHYLQDQAYKSSHLQHHSDSEAEERGTLQAWYPGAAALSTQYLLTTAGGDGALVSQSNEVCFPIGPQKACQV